MKENLYKNETATCTPPFNKQSKHEIIILSPSSSHGLLYGAVVAASTSERKFRKYIPYDIFSRTIIQVKVYKSVMDEEIQSLNERGKYIKSAFICQHYGRAFVYTTTTTLLL